jgi:hypothetical protein
MKEILIISLRVALFSLVLLNNAQTGFENGEMLRVTLHEPKALLSINPLSPLSLLILTYPDATW